MRRDADGGHRIGASWESVTERLIREAQEAGAFDHLPGRGRRLELDDDPREGDMGLAFHILRTNAAVPPWIAADREVRQRADAVERVLAAAVMRGRGGRVDPTLRARHKAHLEQAIAEHTRAVEALEATAPSMMLQRRRIDRVAMLARLDGALDGRADGDPMA